MQAANYRQTIDSMLACSSKKKYFPPNYRGLIDCIMWLFCNVDNDWDEIENKPCLYECDVYIPDLEFLP